MPGGVTSVVVMISRSREGCGEEVRESKLTCDSFPGLEYLSWTQIPPATKRRVNVIAQKDKAFLGSLSDENGDVENG